MDKGEKVNKKPQRRRMERLVLETFFSFHCCLDPQPKRWWHRWKFSSSTHNFLCRRASWDFFMRFDEKNVFCQGLYGSCRSQLKGLLIRVWFFVSWKSRELNIELDEMKSQQKPATKKLKSDDWMSSKKSLLFYYLVVSLLKIEKQTVEWGYDKLGYVKWG